MMPRLDPYTSQGEAGEWGFDDGREFENERDSDTVGSLEAAERSAKSKPKSEPESPEVPESDTVGSLEAAERTRKRTPAPPGEGEGSLEAAEGTAKRTKEEIRFL